MGLAAGLVTLVLSRDRWVQHRWHIAAQRLGMHFQPGSLLEGDKISGFHGRYRVELSNLNRKHTSVVLHAPQLPTNIYCSVRTWDYLRAENTLLIGDPAFDRTVRVSGPADQLQARLTVSARETLAALINTPPRSAASVVVTGGRVTYDVEYHVEAATRLEHIIERLAKVADALALSASVPEQLCVNATDDRELPSVRLRCLQAAIEHYPGHDQTDDTCRALLHNNDPWLRLVAAGHQLDRPAGLDVLRELLEDRQLPDELRILALEAAERVHVAAPQPQAILPARTGPSIDDLLTEIVTDPSAAVRCAVAEALAARDIADPQLLLTLAHDSDDSVATTAVRGLAKIFDRPPADLNGTLVRALSRPAYTVRLAAVDTLSVVGTLEAVGPLKSILRTSFFDQRLRQAARNAIRAIQVRSGNGDFGRLSLAEGDQRTGRLSESERGAISEQPSSETT